MQVFVSEISQTLTVLDELKTENERTAFVAFLKAEINFHGSAYSAAQMAVLKKAYADITARLNSNTMVTTPKWFLPSHELEFDGNNSLAVGGFGTVYRAKWLESDVIVKRINSKKSNNADDDSMFASIPETDSVKQSRKETRGMFEREVGVWFGLSHPHIVRLFGACHVGTPIFVCEYASNGSLDKYLRSHPNDMWLKLYEAALGVQYLHSRTIIHGDLKCNNIVVGRDNKAKVTDFGLSSANVVTGAWRWVAPECLKDGPSALSLASDVYALGMCVVEAMRIVESTTTNQQGFVPLPWGNLENIVVKVRVTRLKELPQRPQHCTDGQWELVKRMCAYDRSDRIKISTVVDELAALAGADATQEPEPESAKLPKEQVAGVIDEMKRSCHLNQPETRSTNQVVLRSVYGLLWDRLADLCAIVKDESGSLDQLEALVGRARMGTRSLGQCLDTLTGFTEMATNGYALHRELDKAIDANFWGVNSSDGELHDWTARCRKVLGAPRSRDNAEFDGHKRKERES
ncbi:Serine/threonine protein kinase [Phytophthora cinnamomi]|uniref:Serine/threonine protein kinase n=1 Tax=Phytophthora cinnamomi TaxID=4785 RepID=UPI00355A172F|nr:Serine/threonine protein kinase [Phytophthora cinnamomi]